MWIEIIATIKLKQSTNSLPTVVNIKISDQSLKELFPKDIHKGKTVNKIFQVVLGHTATGPLNSAQNTSIILQQQIRVSLQLKDQMLSFSCTDGSKIYLEQKYASTL